MTTRTRARRPSPSAALLLAVAVPVVLAGCASGPTAPSAAEITSGAGATWGACMREAGFAVQDPADADVEDGLTQAPAGSEGDAFADAAVRCRAAAGVESASDAQQQRWQRQYAEVASCIRDHGYPDFPEQRPGVLTTDGYPRAEEPAFRDALDACVEEDAPDTTTRSVG